jgi:hypothetical protein
MYPEQRGRHAGVLSEPPGGQDERLHHRVALDQPPQPAPFGEIPCVLPDLSLDILGGLHAVLRLSSFPISGSVSPCVQMCVSNTKCSAIPDV